MLVVIFLLFLLVGIILGLLGAGGSILAVPILVYLFKIDKVEAALYSFFIVAVAALSGALQYIKQKLFRWNVLLFFCFPSLIGIFLSRRILLPMLPVTIQISTHLSISKGALLMLIFALLMLASAFNMLQPKNEKIEADKQPIKIIPSVLIGFIIGILVGFVGAGGGFIIVPALIYFMQLNMKQAVGNSLMVIFINSSIGFLIDGADKSKLNWQLLITCCVAAIIGMVIGVFLSKKITNQLLKKIFGLFILIVGFYILYSELFH